MIKICNLCIFCVTSNKVVEKNTHKKIDLGKGKKSLEEFDFSYEKMAEKAKEKY